MIVRFDDCTTWVSTTPASFGTYPTPLLLTHHRHHPYSPQLPTRIRCFDIMSPDGRSRRRDMVEEAYNLQVKAGLMASLIPFWMILYYSYD